MNSLQEDYPEDIETLTDEQQQEFMARYLEICFNHFGTLAEMFSTHEHNLGTQTYNTHQGDLARLDFRHLETLSRFYNAFEKAANQMDRILFAEIPAKISAKNITIGDILAWRQALFDAFMETRECAIALMDA